MSKERIAFRPIGRRTTSVGMIIDQCRCLFFPLVHISCINILNS